MTKPTWFDRDLPVLRAIVELDEEPGRSHVRESDIVKTTGFDGATVSQSLKALSSNDPPYANIKQVGMSGVWMVASVSGHARREVGQWPSPKTQVEEQVAALLAALEQAADDAPDDESKGKLEMALRTLKDVPASVLGAVSTAVFLKFTGLG